MWSPGRRPAAPPRPHQPRELSGVTAGAWRSARYLTACLRGGRPPRRGTWARRRHAGPLPAGRSLWRKEKKGQCQRSSGASRGGSRNPHDRLLLCKHLTSVPKWPVAQKESAHEGSEPRPRSAVPPSGAKHLPVPAKPGRSVYTALWNSGLTHRSFWMLPGPPKAADMDKAGIPATGPETAAPTALPGELWPQPGDLGADAVPNTDTGKPRI